MDRLLHSNKRAFLSWLWLPVPLLAAIALQVGIGAYCRYIQAMLDRRLSLVQVAPDMITQLAIARKETRNFALASEQRDSIVEVLGTKLHNLVQQGGFHIDSLSVEKSGVVDGISSFHMALNGMGDLPAIARFLYAAQCSERLMSADYVHLIPHKGANERNYTVELSFQYFVLPP